MKKFLILILICFIQSVYSQKETKNKNSDSIPYIPVHTVVEEATDIYNVAGIEVRPEFPGGQEALDRFLKDNYKNPKKDLKGKVYATFIIEKDGSLSDIKTIRDLGFGTKEEAIRVLKLSPKWNPGKQNEKVVRVLYAMPIVVN